ncbi:hypothetical protein FACS1894218_5330 [Bacilli bacterium]|nr:hypothetical protein FACS1894218_5330 [Bacilli bacterium]
MKQKKSLAQNGSRKKAALIGCSIAGTAVLMAGAGVGVGYIVFNKPGQAGYEVETNKSGLYESDKDDEVKISVVLDHKNIDGAEFDIIQADS